MSYKCPICQSELVERNGNQIHPDNPEFGVILYCVNKSCPAQEVMGHAYKPKDAYQVILDKFVPRVKSS